jgi:hypothetical protein
VKVETLDSIVIAMLDYYRPKYLPSAEELPDSDETPVDNELQELIPGLLKSILLMLWEERENYAGVTRE